MWELGWLLKALPLFAVGVLFWVTARPWIGERTRRSWDRGWMTVLAVLPLWVLHPLVSATVIATKVDLPHHRHWASDTVVNTGILPLSFHAAEGQLVHVSSTGLGHVAGLLSVNGSLMLHDSCVPALVGLDRPRFGRGLAARRLPVARVAQRRGGAAY